MRQLHIRSGASSGAAARPAGVIASVGNTGTFPNYVAHVAISRDGINWYERKSGRPTPANGLQRMCWSPNLNLFAGTSGNQGGGASAKFETGDGDIWTARSYVVDNQMNAVCWGNGLFVAVASTGGVTNQVATSPDGVTWTNRTAANTSFWGSVVWAQELGLYIAASFASSTFNFDIMTSSNGTAWTLRATPGEVNILWQGLAYSQSLKLLVVVGSVNVTNLGRCMTSPDGINWTLRTVPTANQWFFAVWSPERNLFVAIAASGTNRIMTSPDGINWTARTSSDKAWSSMAWFPDRGIFVISVGSSTDGVPGSTTTSPDGINWTDFSNNLPPGCYHVAVAPGLQG